MPRFDDCGNEPSSLGLARIYPRRSTRLTELVTPLKPLEVMAQERLVLASNVGGHRELIVDGRTGFLFTPDDPEDLVRRLDQLLARRDLWPGIRARARDFVARERTWQAVVTRYEDAYGRAMRARDATSLGR